MTTLSGHGGRRNRGPSSVTAIRLSSTAGIRFVQHADPDSEHITADGQGVRAPDRRYWGSVGAKRGVKTCAPEDARQQN
jgi:hypothetical protein